MKRLAVIFGFLLVKAVSGQYCDPLTPFLNVNLSGQPNGKWISPAVLRQGHCCSASGPDACLQFNLTLDSAAQMVSFNLASGAMPGGSLFY